MNKFRLDITANFRPPGGRLPTIEEQYIDLWRFAKELEEVGIPLDEWYPPAKTKAGSVLNLAFGDTGPTSAALAMATADKVNHAPDTRGLGVWNGHDVEGGMSFSTLLSVGHIPASLDFGSCEIEALRSYSNVVRLVRAILEIWSPLLIQVGLPAYSHRQVFKDRPAVSWMVYLPLVIKTENAPEASELIAVFDQDKKQKGTIVVSVAETFDVANPEHVKRANDIEVRLADQDLLPRLMDFVRM